MFDYLQKFNQLPKDLRDKVSTSSVMAAINELEKKYGINLASTVMKVMAKEIKFSDLVDYFLEEGNLDTGKAEELAKAMAEKIFVGVKDYLKVEAGGQEKKRQEKPAKEEVEKEAAPVVRGASFFFSPEDEEEIRELTKKINGELKVALTDEQIEDKLNKIIASTQINFGSQELSDRFRSILKTYLRGIRDKIEIKQTLKKTFADGGLGFDNNSADEVLKITDSIVGGEKVSVRPPVKIRLPEDGLAGKETEDKTVALKNIGVRDIDYSFSSPAVRKEEKEDVSVPPVNLSAEEKDKKEEVKLDVSHEIAPPPPVVIEKRPVADTAKVVGPSRVESRIPVNPVRIIPKSQPARPAKGEAPPVGGPREAGQPLTDNLVAKKGGVISSRVKDFVSPPLEFKRSAAKSPLRTPTPAQSAGKKKMEDVKYVPPRVMNPIDELRYMDLVNFRRLSPEAGKQVAKIKEKISLLEEENYSRRTEGIKGWRQSSVNKLYLSIGQQSISEGKPVDVIIEERKNVGQDCLTLEEFKAIMDLNKELRF